MVKIFLGNTQIGGGGSSGGTEVIPNPEALADAPTLGTISIGGVVYKIPNANLTLLAENVEMVLEA